jgi:hypothetical protein
MLRSLFSKQKCSKRALKDILCLSNRSFDGFISFISKQRLHQKIKNNLSEFLKETEVAYKHPTTPEKTSRFGPQRSNAVRRPKKKGRAGDKSPVPPTQYYFDPVTGLTAPGSAIPALNRGKTLVHPKFADVARISSQNAQPAVRLPLDYSSPLTTELKAAVTICRQAKFGLFIDTNVPIIDEKIIDLSDRFDHFEYFQRRYAEWHTIPLHQVREQEMLSLYNRVIRRSFDMGLITRQYNSSIIAMTGDENAFERDVQNFMNVYSKFPIEEIPTELKKLGDSLKSDYGALFRPDTPPPFILEDLDLDEDLDAILAASRAARARRTRTGSF